MTYRKPIFTKRNHYRVKQDFTSHLWTFAADEVLIFHSDGYVAYDACFVYEFRSQCCSEEKIWMLHEDAPEALWRDYFEPLGPIAIDPTWLTSTVVSLAKAIYAKKAFEGLPILADALEDAGCTSQEILNHLRLPEEHVKGCWALDLILQKE